MKKKLVTAILSLAVSSAFAQLQIDNQLQMTGGTEASRRITNIGAPAGINDAVNAASIQKGSLQFATASGSGGNYTVNLSPAPTAYEPGMIINFKANHANTGAATLKVGTLAIADIKVGVTDNLAPDDIKNNQMVSVIYDGANFQLLSRGTTAIALPPSGAAGGDLTGTYPNPDIAANAVASAEITNASITAADLATTGVGAGTYTSVTVNAQGQVTGGTNPGFTTGSGANGHVSYWTSATAQSYDSDGNYFWDASNNRLGIGTISPERRLHIAGTGSGLFEAKIGSGAVAQNATLDVIANHDNIAFQVWDDNNLTTPRFIVTRGGSVGIGTTSPATYLQVGQNTAANNTDYQVAIFRHGTTTSPGTYTNSSPALNITDISGDGAASVDGMGLLYVAAPRIADGDINSNNALLVNVINDNGTGLAVTGKRNVGVGTNAPGYRLTVSTGAIGGNFGITPNYAGWAAYGVGDGGAAIYNDNGSYKKLMVVGNNSAGGEREVGLWDNLTVNGGARITDLSGSGTRLVTADASGKLSTRATDARNVTSSSVSGMNPNSRYLACVYGITADRGNDGATLAAMGVRNCAGTVTLASTPAVSVNWPDGNAPQSHCFVITAPADGCITGFTDGGAARYITVAQLD